MVNANRQEDPHEQQAVPQPRGGLESRHVLGEKDGEGIDEGGAVTHAVPDHDDRHGRHPVVAKGERQGDENGDEGKILFAESDGGRPNREQGDSPGHQPEGSVSPPPEQSSHRGIHRTRSSKNGEGTSDDQGKENNFVSFAETFGNRRQEGKGR